MVRAYTQYRIFEGSEQALNTELMAMQSDTITIINVHKLYDSTYEVLFHISTSTDDIVEVMTTEEVEEE